jgi:mannose-1-phosphate guanylyltransferase
MAVVTADQIIEPADVFQQALEDALACVNTNPDSMVVFGIKPDYPSIQLGYLKCSAAGKCPGSDSTIYTVEQFKEKPNEQTAIEYIKTGRYFWNSGMFVWKAKTILDNLAQFLPDATEPLKKIREGWDTPKQNRILAEWFRKLPKISIDFAVMEKAANVNAIKLDCRWLDLGSFAALADIINSDKNNNVVVAGASELLGCNNSIIVTEEKGHLIAAVGLDNMVVAHSPDATLVCHIDQTHRLKELLDLIKQHEGEKFI